MCRDRPPEFRGKWRPPAWPPWRRRGGRRARPAHAGCGVTIANWLTLFGSLAAGFVGAGLALGRLEAVKARVTALERGNADKGRRLERVTERLAVIDFKLFGRHPAPAGGGSPDGEATPT